MLRSGFSSGAEVSHVVRVKSIENGGRPELRSHGPKPCKKLVLAVIAAVVRIGAIIGAVQFLRVNDFVRHADLLHHRGGHFALV